ncbi:MAG: class I SAM-dependent methyltransferase [Thermodesulfobacteriota bacterium]
MATQSEYDTYYETHSIYQSNELGTGSGVGEFDKKRLSDFSLMISEHFRDRATTILDVGCANGGLLCELRTLGYTDITGMDPAEPCVRNVRNRGIKGIIGRIHPEGGCIQALTETRFDLIIMTGVLEHIRDLQGAVEFLTTNLRPDGCAFIRVPDATRYSSHYLLPYYYFDIEHINHFGHNDLLNLFCTQGFDLLASGAVDFSVSHQLSYPDIYAVFRRSPAANWGIRYSGATKCSIIDFIHRSDADDYGMTSLKELYASQEAAVVWGAGMNTYRLLASSLLGKCNIAAFVDGEVGKQGQILMGKPIVPPEFLYDFKGPVLLCTAFYNDQIEQKLNHLRLPNRLIRL